MEKSEDGTIDWELFSKEKEFGKYKATIGPGVYTYDSDLTWYEANDWCNDTFGSELAILSDTKNDNTWQTIDDIIQEHSHATITNNFA